MSGGTRLFDLLLRLCPTPARERFGAGMRYAWTRDRAAARARGPRAVIGFWVVTIVEALRFAAAERARGISPRASLTVDWRDAWRSLRAAPLVGGFAVLSLALGIGGVTALFSILNSLTLRPLPVRDPQRLALLADTSWTNPIWEAIRDRRHQFAEDAFAWGNDRFNLAPGAAADMVDGFWVSGNMFDVLGVKPAIGRLLMPSDDRRGGGADGAVVAISYAMWQRRFGGTADVVGRTLLVERVPFTIVGVAEKGFFGPDVGRSFDIALPLGAEPLVLRDRSRLDGRSTWWMNIMARLRPGQSAEEATRQLRAIQLEIRAVTLPEGRADMRDRYLTDPFTLTPSPGGRSPLRARYQEPLTVILGVFAVVLLIACANVANLLIARASDRRHELTVRLALGASRARIARQLIAESFCLGAAGAALGIWFAQWGSRLLVSQLSSVAVAVDLDLRADWRVLAFAAAVSIAATVLFGVAPALAATRIAPNDVLKEHGRTPGVDRRGLLRRASVVVQVALSLSLVAGAGLFARTFVALDRRDLGVDRKDVLLIATNVSRNPVRGPARTELFSRIVAAVQSVPGVASASLSFTTPVARSGRNIPMDVPPGSPLTRQQRMSWVNVVAPRWFDTIGIRFVAGRDFDARDTAGAPPVAVVNRAFAARFLPGVDPVGAQFFIHQPVTEGRRGYQVVGLVEDSVYRSVRDAAPATMYLPLTQDESDPVMTVVVRPAVALSETFSRSLAAAIEREDRDALLTFRSLDEQIAATLTQERVLATVAVFLGALGLLLAAVGLYGVTSQAVTSRRGEIGIRMALGASARGVVRMVIARIAVLVAAGIIIGAALSVWVAGYVGTLLYGLQPRDPVTFVSAAGMLAAVATLAAWLPARRASRIDPMQTLRN